MQTPSPAGLHQHLFKLRRLALYRLRLRQWPVHTRLLPQLQWRQLPPQDQEPSAPGRQLYFGWLARTPQGVYSRLLPARVSQHAGQTEIALLPDTSTADQQSKLERKKAEVYQRAEDRVHAAAAMLAAQWKASGLVSPILALDDRGDEVRILIDVKPTEDERIGAVMVELAQARSDLRIRWDNAQTLVVTPEGETTAPEGGPLLAPVLRHGRGRRTMRFVSLNHLRHLGIYGGEALGTVHAILESQLYFQSPEKLALAILDNGDLCSRLYERTPHFVQLPAGTVETVDIIMQALRWPVGAPGPRTLLLVVAEPDDATLIMLGKLLRRRRTQLPAAPLHILLAQTHLRSAGREVYALLPALISGGGLGCPAWLPGQTEWPRRGNARLITRGLDITGSPLQISEPEMVTALGQMEHAAELNYSYPPVLWQIPDRNDPGCNRSHEPTRRV